MNTLIIRVDATPISGTGHVMRSLALAQVWQGRGGKVVFISHCESEALQQRIGAEGINLFSLEKPHPDLSDWNLTKGILDTFKIQGTICHPWVVVDGYHFDAGYQKNIKTEGYKLLWIDDYGHADYYYADLILNQNISADSSCYLKRESYTKLLMGPSYALLRREFDRWRGWQRENPTMARKVLVTFGGADSHNVTLKAIKALKQIKIPELEARVVVGSANRYVELLRQEAGADSRLQILNSVTDMSDLMAWADVAISAGGTTCCELAFMGLPGVILTIAENQKANAEALNREGIAINLGWYKDLSAERLNTELGKLMINANLRSLMSQRGQNLVDGAGGGRVLHSLHL